MYQNKKIVPIVTADIDLFDNDESFYSTPHFDLFCNLYKLPQGQDSTSINTYFSDNQVCFPYNEGYGSRYESRLLTWDYFKSNGMFRNGHQASQVHELGFWLKFEISFYRTRHSNTAKIHNHAVLNYMDYNWDSHSSLLTSNDYLPILIEPDSFLHDSYYKKFFAITPSARLNISSITPNFVLSSSEDIQFVLWRKLNYKYQHEQSNHTSIDVYSNFSSPLFNNMKESILNYNSETKTFLNLPVKVSSNQPAISGNRAYYRNSSTLVKTFQSRMTLGEGFDISFVKNSANQDLYCNLIQESSRKRFDVIKVPSWKTKSSDKEISFTSYTKSQCLKRQTSFMGFVDVVNCLISSDTVEDRHVFNLVSTADFDDLATSSRALKKLIEFIEAVTWKNGIKIYDPEKVAEIYAEIYAGLNTYSDACCSKLSKEHLDLIVQTDVPKVSIFDSHKNEVLTAEPKVDLSLKNKYTKIDTLYNQNLNSIADPKIKDQARLARASYREFKQYQASLTRAQEEITKYIDELCLSIKEIYSSASFIKANKSLYNSIQNKYLKAYNESLKNSSYSLDDFFNNLTKDKIHITEIQYQPNAAENLVKTISSSSSQISVVDFIKAKNFNSNFKIKSLEFVIDRPVKIRVDAKDKYVVAGPYKVKCDQSNIYVCLLKKESLFGYSGDSYAIHPHTGAFSTPAPLFQYYRGCMGEATSLIYNAFKKNDLKLILLSAMTWITSANSSDPWGRKYDWFPEIKDLKDVTSEQQPEDQENVTEDDVSSFLSSVCEEEVESEEEHFIDLPPPEQPAQVEAQDSPDPQTQTQQNVQTRWNPNAFSDQPENYVPAFPANTNS